MADKNSNISSDNSESETELLVFKTLKLLETEPKKKVSDENYTEYKCQPKDGLNEQRGLSITIGVNLVGFVS